jgi:dihydroorotase
MLIRNAVTAGGEPIALLLRDGRIAAMGLSLEALCMPGEEVLDASGKTVLPAFIDLHCHFRTPGFAYKETLETGSAAAAAGGYTFVNLMPNTSPVMSDPGDAFLVQQRVHEIGLVEANQTVSITENFDGKTIDHLKTLPETVKFITEDGHGVQNTAVMAKAFAICHQKGITVMSHAEDSDISPWDYRLAEDIETVRNLYLSEYYQTRLHLCHVSTRGAIEAVAAAKYRGAPVSCEVTPHHLFFTKDTLDYRVNPPVRDADDVSALIDAIQIGTIDAIATDHAPHSEADKLGGAAGMVGLETAFGVCYTKLCREEHLPLALLSELMSAGPAAILGLDRKGVLAPGADADLVLVDLDTPWVVDKAALHSKSHNCPYDGKTLYGCVLATIKGGKTTYTRPGAAPAYTII